MKNYQQRSSFKEYKSKKGEKETQKEKFKKERERVKRKKVKTGALAQLGLEHPAHNLRPRNSLIH